MGAVNVGAVFLSFTNIKLQLSRREEPCLAGIASTLDICSEVWLLGGAAIKTFGT